MMHTHGNISQVGGDRHSKLNYDKFAVPPRLAKKGLGPLTVRNSPRLSRGSPSPPLSRFGSVNLKTAFGGTPASYNAEPESHRYGFCAGARSGLSPVPIILEGDYYNALVSLDRHLDKADEKRDWSIHII